MCVLAISDREDIEKNAGRMEYFENLSLLLSDYMGNDCPSRDALLDIFGKVPIYSTIVVQ